MTADDGSVERPGLAGYEPYATICRQLYDGDTLGARKAFDLISGEIGLHVPSNDGTYERTRDVAVLGTEDPVGSLCENFLVTREWCRAGAFDGSGAIRPPIADLCPSIEHAFGAFPERPSRPTPRRPDALDAGAP